MKFISLFSLSPSLSSSNRRLKAELEKKESEFESEKSRMTSKNTSEVNELKYQLTESETKKKDLGEEIERLKMKVAEQLNSKELQEHISTLRQQLDLSEQKVKTIQDDNERLQEESNSVS